MTTAAILQLILTFIGTNWHKIVGSVALFVSLYTHYLHVKSVKQVKKPRAKSRKKRAKR